MTPDQLATLAASGESEILECNAATDAGRETGATACAMLNQRGSHVPFGVFPDSRLVGQWVAGPPAAEHARLTREESAFAANSEEAPIPRPKVGKHVRKTCAYR